jgi:hypothetical protein
MHVLTVAGRGDGVQDTGRVADDTPGFPQPPPEGTVRHEEIPSWYQCSTCGAARAGYACNSRYPGSQADAWDESSRYSPQA